MKNSRVPFDGVIVTFVSCMIPIFNILYVIYYLLIGLTTDEDKLIELRRIMRDMKDGR